MFTGIIEETGRVIEIKPITGGRRLKIEAKLIPDDLLPGHSVSVSGVCLTAVQIQTNSFCAEAVGATLEKSTLARLSNGQQVNLERALRLSDRLGGHLVQGHVNGTGTVTKLQRNGENWNLELSIPADLMRYIISEGSIAIDGVSLTVANILENKIGISVIAHTFKNTTISDYRVGSEVNLETDFLAKYLENFLKKGNSTNPVFSEDWFKQHGY